MLRSIDKGAVLGYNPHRTAGYSPLPITFARPTWMCGSWPTTGPEGPRDVALNSERPGRNMFAQGAMTTIARRRRGPLPTTPRESGSNRRLEAQIKHEPSRMPPVHLPRPGRGC